MPAGRRTPTEPKSAAQAQGAASSGEEPAGIGRNTVFSLVTQATTALFTAGLTLFLVRALEPASYGTFALAVSIGALLLLPSDFGLSQAAARFIAERRGRRAEIADILSTALGLKLVATGAVSIGLVLAAAPLASAYDAPALEWPVRGVALALFGQSLMSLYSATFTAVGRVSVVLKFTTAKSVTEAMATVALVLTGMAALGAALGRAAGFAVGAGLAVLLALRHFGRRSTVPRVGDRSRVRQVGQYAGALLIIDGAFAAFQQIDILLIGAFLGTAAVGLFEPVLRLVTFLHYPGYALASGIAPRVARGVDEQPNVAAFEAGLRGLLIFQAALLAPVIVWADPIVRLLLGAEYAASASVLRALAPFIFLWGLAPLVSTAVNYLGEARRRIPIAIGAVALNAAVDVALLPRVGIVAGAIGTDLAFMVYVPAHFWICRRLLGIRLKPLGLTLARSLVAAAAMSAVLLALGTEALSLLEWVAGAVGGAAAFAAVLLLTREVSPAEAAAAIARVRGLAR